MQKRETETVLTSLGFLRRETGARSGCVEGLPQSLHPAASPKAQRPTSGKVIPIGSWRRGQSAPRTRKNRGRQSSPEPLAACSRRPRWSEGSILGQRRPITPRSSCFGEDLLPPSNSRSQHCRSSHCVHLKNHPESQKSWYWGEMKCSTQVEASRVHLCQTQMTCFQHSLKFQRNE